MFKSDLANVGKDVPSVAVQVSSTRVTVNVPAGDSLGIVVSHFRTGFSHAFPTVTLDGECWAEFPISTLAQNICWI